MKAMLIQPFYFPWIGLFDMMDQSELFIFYDDAQYSRGGWQSRNRIKSANGVIWLSVGIDRSYKLGEKINAIKVNHASGWVEKNLNQLYDSYHQAPHFEEYFPIVSKFLNSKFDRLLDYSVGSIELVRKILGIDKKIIFASQLGITGSRGRQKVVDICLKAGANEYLDGATGKELYDPDFFSKQGIGINFHEYNHPVYGQLYGDFVSHLSVLDLLFNEGDKSLSIIRSGRPKQ